MASALNRFRGIALALAAALAAPAAEDKKPDPGIFGVMVSGPHAARAETVQAVLDLHARWVRVNTDFDKVNPDFRRYLEKGVDVVVCVSNHDPDNLLEGEYGAGREWPNAGFPCRDRAAYQKRVLGILEDALPHLKAGRRCWMQCENEIGDASLNPKSRFWRGTLEQYRDQLKAFAETVRAFNDKHGTRVPVVLSSFTSEGLDALVAPSAEASAHEAKRQRYVLRTGQALLDLGELYDVVDLHMYGDPKNIPSKVRWVREHMPKGHPFTWISTECGGPDYRAAGTPVRWDKDREGFEALQARQVVERFRLASENGASACLWFSLIDLRGETDVFKHLGLMEPSWPDPPVKKPAYTAFREFMEGLELKGR